MQFTKDALTLSLTLTEFAGDNNTIVHSMHVSLYSIYVRNSVLFRVYLYVVGVVYQLLPHSSPPLPSIYLYTCSCLFPREKLLYSGLFSEKTFSLTFLVQILETL